ncbi:ABC transporter substrate-binding protein, partial [Mesorhizobium sp. M2E.F.Ca.ET.166.01.1.1]
GNDQPVSPANIFHNADLKPKAFDPDKAKFHFQKSGLLGQSIPVIASEAATSSIDMAVIIQAAGADIGMKLDVQRVPSDGYWDNYWLKAPIHFGNINPRPTPDILFSLLYASNAPWNESQYKSEKFDKLLVEARGSLDQAKRKEIYGDMQTMVSEEAGTIIPAYISNVDALSSKVKGLEANPLGGMMGYAMAEYLWLEA